MTDDNPDKHDEVDLRAVLEAAQTALQTIPDADGAAPVQISEVIADYQQASSGYEVDLSTLFDSIAAGETAAGAGDPTAVAGAQLMTDVGDGIDLSALFDADAETDGHIETAQMEAGIPADSDNTSDGFTTFTTVAAYPGAITALYGDDGHDRSGTSAG